MPAVRGHTLGSFGQAFMPLSITGAVPRISVAIELAASYTPIVALSASDTPLIALAASDTPIIELEAEES